MVEAELGFEINNPDPPRAPKFLHEDLVVIGKVGAGA